MELSGWTELFRLLFGQLGALGTVCVVAAAWMAWMHQKEKDDHKETRQLMYAHFEKVVALQVTVATVLAELKQLIEEDTSVGDLRRSKPSKRI